MAVTGSAAAHWLGSGFFDEEFYSALRGRAFPSAEAAAEDFVLHGLTSRLSPHPFLDFLSLPPRVRRAWREGDSEAVLDYLGAHAELFDPPGTGDLATLDPVLARARMLDVAGRLAGEQPSAAPDWDPVEPRVDGRVSVLISTRGDARAMIRAARAVLKRSALHDVEVVLVDNALPVPAALALERTALALPGTRVARLSSTTGVADAANAGFACSTGSVLVLLDGSAEVRAGWLPPLLAELDDTAVAGAQPVLLREDDTIASAGSVLRSRDQVEWDLLSGHPKEDARRLAGARLVAVRGDVLAVRAADFARLRGFDAHEEDRCAVLDLCLRMLPSRPGGFRVAPTSLVTRHGATSSGDRDPADGCGTLLRRWADRLPAPAPDLGERLEVRGDGDVLRWAIKLPSTAGHWGDEWGDTHFGEELGHALRTLGQDAVTYRRGAHTSEMTRLDDVSVAIRGLYPIPPMADVLNVLWVISHPDDVAPEELEGYDLVFAASPSWSRRMSELSGRPVVPLLQASSISRPPVPDRAVGTTAVFVGNTNNGRERPLVHLAVDAGIPLAVYGRGWDGRLPPGVWHGEYVDQAELPALYARSGFVVADHWPDMAREGFVANRVFDAVASGAHVMCDEVPGVEELFPDAVRVCRTAEDVRAFFGSVRARRASGEPPAATQEFGHSFVARAAQLCAAVREHRG